MQNNQNEQKKEKISKLISYWLRHKPEDGNIELDRYGWANIKDVINALNSNNFNFTSNQLIELNSSFDKVRWKIDLSTQKIKATHGHSIFIEQELNSKIPNEILFHGTASKNLIGIIKNGLISRKRQYVHLSENIEMAREVGKRHGKPIIIEIDTIELIENGWEFFKTEESVWLTSNIPIEYLYFEPWIFIERPNVAESIMNELKKEFRWTQKIYWRLKKLKLIASHMPSDDYLFIDSDSKIVYVIHPTWSGKKEIRHYPTVEKYRNLEEWIEKRLIPDQKDWYLHNTMH